MSAILSILASPVLGSITGFIGQYLTRKEERAMKQAEFTHAERMLEAQNKQAILIAEKKLQGVIEEAKIKVEQEEVGAFRDSQKTTSTVGESIKNWVRAALVSYVAIVCLVLTIMVYCNIGGLGAMDKVALVALFSDAVAQFFFMFGLAFSWFYGVRGSSSQKAKEQSKK